MIGREAGFTEREWARCDPDLAILHGEAEFEKLCPARGRGGVNPSRLHGTDRGRYESRATLASGNRQVPDSPDERRWLGP